MANKHWWLLPIVALLLCGLIGFWAGRTDRRLAELEAALDAIAQKEKSDG